MFKIRQDIENNQIGNLYILLGNDLYLRNMIRDELKKAIVGEGTSMNETFVSGKKVDAYKVIDSCETMPFMAERRLVIVENSAINQKAPDEWVEYISHVCESTCLVIVENSLDGRSKFYKACKKYGYIANVDDSKKKYVEIWVKDWLSKNRCAMSSQDIQFLINRVSDDFGVLDGELCKLRDHGIVWNADHTISEQIQTITQEDIVNLCAPNLEDRVFQMIDFAFSGKGDQAFELYNDLKLLKVAPVKILSNLNRQVNILLQIKDHKRLKHSDSEAISAMKIHPFVYKKNIALSQKLKYALLMDLLKYGVQLDEDFKRGRIKADLAVELMLSKCILK